MAEDKNLFADFPALSKAQWKERIVKELKGRPWEDLQWHLGNNIELTPFYQKEDLATATFALGSHRPTNDWAIGEDFEADDAKKCNAEVLEALLHGLDAPCFYWSSDRGDFQLPVLLKGIRADFIQIHLRPQTGHLALLEQFVGYQIEQGIDPKSLRGSIQLNGATAAMHRDSLAFALHELPLFACFITEASAAHQGAESAVNELTELLKRACDLVVEAQNLGFSAEQTAHRLTFDLRVGTSYFVELAKIRALQILWPLFLKGFDLDDLPAPSIAAHLAPQAQVADQDLNMIRCTTQSMSAILGGATRLTVLPADAYQDSTSTFTRRLARNVQHLLKMESYLDRVVDPASGSYYLEALTQQIAEQAWFVFQAKEASR